MRQLFFAFLLVPILTYSQKDSGPLIRTEKISIARDSFGVPHIFAPTDPEVAYGLAWAHAEDDFKTIQTLILTGKGKLGSYLGKEGATVDYVFALLDSRRTVMEQMHTLNPKLISLIKGYLKGLETYAQKHPGEVLNKYVFPISVEDYLASVSFSVAVFSGVDKVLPQILQDKMPTLPDFKGEGSNAIAVHAKHSVSGENMLVINAHQPIEGPTAFYEAHLQSEEGWNILGGCFPGAPLIFHGVNKNLAWAHTVNFQDKVDVFQLETDKEHPGQYKVDGEWLMLEKRRISLKVKGIPVNIKKTVYRSIYGPTVQAPSGTWFSIRLPALLDAGALQQWYAMNHASNFSEFYAALKQNHLSMFNIVYADRYDTIFYISNGKMPVRNPNPNYHWNSTVPGNTKATLWTSFKPLSALPQYLNPPSGYLYNTNHSPFLATSPRYNLNPALFDRNDGYELYNNNRSQRAYELLSPLEKISYEDLKRIKFDRELPKKILYPYGYTADSLFMVDENSYPQLTSLIKSLKEWDHKAVPESKGALVYLMAYYNVTSIMNGRNKDTLTIPEAVQVYQKIYDHLMKYFKSIDLTLGDVQKLVRGDESWPQGGMPDVLAAVQSTNWKNGLRRMNSGDAYIGFVRFPKDGGLPFIETVNTFGASSIRGNKHFADQRAMYQSRTVKQMTLDKEEVLRKAESVYHPE